MSTPFADLVAEVMGTGGGTTPTADDLRSAGESAARLHMSGVPLEDAVVKVASGMHSLTQEHARRVTEFANVTVHNLVHEKHKLSGASSSSPHFPLAEPDRVVQRLNADEVKGSPTSIDTSYAKLPDEGKRKTSAHRRFDAWLEGGSREEPETREQVLKGVQRDLHDLEDTLGRLKHAAQELDSRLDEATDAYWGSFKRHLLSGGGFDDVLNAANSTGFPPDKTAEALDPFVKRAISEGLATDEDIVRGAVGLSKVAHRILDRDHPLVSRFGEIAELNRELRKVAVAEQDLSSRTREFKSFIHKNSVGNILSTVGTALGVAGAAKDVKGSVSKTMAGFNKDTRGLNPETMGAQKG